MGEGGGRTSILRVKDKVRMETETNSGNSASVRQSIKVSGVAPGKVLWSQNLSVG